MIKSQLAVLVDGQTLPEDEARALWKDFSHYMDEHRSDLAGFARSRGWTSVSPEHRAGQAVLVVQTHPGAPTKPTKATPPRST